MHNKLKVYIAWKNKTKAFFFKYDLNDGTKAFFFLNMIWMMELFFDLYIKIQQNYSKGDYRDMNLIELFSEKTNLRDYFFLKL